MRSSPRKSDGGSRAAGPERRRLAAALLAVTAAGFASKGWDGPGAAWLNDSVAGLLYVVFWCLAAALLWPRASPGRIAFAVLAATCALEVLQLWQPLWLERLRATFWGRTLLGTTFVGSDFFYYFLGAGVGWAFISRKKILEKSRRQG